jgi:cold shock protein
MSLTRRNALLSLPAALAALVAILASGKTSNAAAPATPAPAAPPIAPGPALKSDTATVKWFNRLYGFGFLGRPDKSDIWFHGTKFDMTGVERIRPGLQVRVRYHASNLGLTADEVRVIGDLEKS